MAITKVALLTLFMTLIASGSYFSLLYFKFDNAQAAAGACFVSVIAPLAVYRKSKKSLGRFLTMSQVLVLLVTALAAAAIPYVKPQEEYIFPIWYLLGIIGMNIMVWMIFRLRKNGARLTPGELEKQKELWRQYGDLEIDFQDELDRMGSDKPRKERLERMAKYVRLTKDEIERLIREHEPSATLRPPPALGSDPSASSIPPAPRIPYIKNGKLT